VEDDPHQCAKHRPTSPGSGQHATARSAPAEVTNRCADRGANRCHQKALRRLVARDIRGDLQALDLEDLAGFLKKGVALYEGNPFIARALQTHGLLPHVRHMP